MLTSHVTCSIIIIEGVIDVNNNVEMMLDIEYCAIKREYDLLLSDLQYNLDIPKEHVMVLENYLKCWRSRFVERYSKEIA